jgi:MFS family permease
LQTIQLVLTATFAPVFALLLSTALLLMGNGLQGTLLPVRANMEAFGATDIGLIGTAYFAGFGAGCILGARLVRRAGHIRTFAAMASLASAVALAHAILVAPLPWWLLRAVTGFCFAVLYVVIESWLNERSSNENRGTVFSVYTIVNLTVITAGQMMLPLADPKAFILFATASILVSLAVVPVSLTAAPAPTPVVVTRMRIRRLYGISPVGVAGVLTVGFANGAFWALAPVFAQDSGLDTAGIALFMSTAVIAGAVSQWPLGRLSDKVDRRRVVLLICVLATAAGVGLSFFNDGTQAVMLGLAALFGAFAFPLYAVCVAHVNDHTSADDFVETSSGLLLLYAAGAMLGPIPASLVMSRMGPEGLFAFTMVFHAAMAVFTVYRMTRRKAPSPEEKESFVSVGRTSPTMFEFDPRGEEETAADEETAEREREAL